MIDILQKFIKAERVDQWELHLQAVYEMMPYIAASGHNLYVKSAYLYLQFMQDVKEHNPDVWMKFEDGFHSIVTGVTVGQTINADKAKEVGDLY